MDTERRSAETESVAADHSGDVAAALNTDRPEFRSVPFTDFESKNDGWAFEGLAAVYDQPADLGEFTEEFMRGAFRRPLSQGDNTRLIYEHAPPHLPVLATRHGGTLHIKDDPKGLVVRGEIARHYMGEAARELIKRGDIKGMSPGMVVGRGNSELSRRNGKLHRAIRALKHLPEISLTSDPVYAGTSAEMRSWWAMRVAESMGLPQQALLGTVADLQPERRAMVSIPTAIPVDAPPVDTPPVDTPPDAPATEGLPPAPTNPAPDDPAPVEDVPAEAGGDQQRSGADPAEVQAEAAARKRRLQMMEMTLPSNDPFSRAPIAEEVRSRPVAERKGRPLAEILEFPRETWSPEERNAVNARIGELFAERSALMERELRHGLSPEEQDKFRELDAEFEQLRG